jgi:type III secretion system YscQ/HrcQ family protein
LTAQGYNAIPQKPSAQFEVEDYGTPGQPGRWARDSGSRSGAGGDPGGGNGRSRQPAAQGAYAPESSGRGAAPGAGYPPPAGGRPQPGLGATPLVEPRAASQAPPRSFARALGMPGANAPMSRPRNTRPLEMSDLEPISRESVELWKALIKAFPGYFHAPELAEACSDFLKSILGEGAAPSRAVTLEIKRREDGTSESRETYDQEISIGTHTQNTLQVMGAQISRRHCRIVHDERGYCLVDQGSSNGTFLRGERVQPGYAYPLKNGESFSIPGHDISLKWPEGDSAPKLASLKVASLRIEPMARFFEGTPAQGLIAMVRLEPGGLRLFLELDLPLAGLAVARVLGPAAGQGAATTAAAGGGSAGVPIRPLSEVEKGVLELLVVRLLDAAQKRWGERAEMTFHLERLVEARDPRIREQAATGQAIVASVGIEFDTRRDSVRLALPDSALAALSPRLETVVPRAGEAIGEVFLRLRDAIGSASVEVRAVVGQSKLTPAELAGLTVGDIIVPTEFTLKAGESGLAGQVDLLLGAGRGEARMRGEVVGWDGNMYKVRVDEFLKGSGRRETQVSEGEMVEGDVGAEAPPEGGEAPADAEGAQILEDVPLPLVVELGRLNMTVREIAELRRGQVLDLGRGASEPVALVVEGRMIGAGKLVNVEGEIGVQITNLAR